MSGRRFPALQARDLDGRSVDLPGGFEGDPTVAIVAFRRQQQDDVDSWLPWLGERAAALPGLRIYEIPTISWRWAPFRPMIDGGMAAAIRDPATRRRTLTTYTGVRRVLDALGLRGTGQIAVLVLDRDGTELARALGPFSQAGAEQIAPALGGG